MATQDLILPELRPRTNFHTIPKRYEETKPVAMQNFSHKNILYIGKDIHSQILNRCSYEKDSAVEAAEQVVWAQAEVHKKKAVAEAVKKVKAEHEQFLKKLKKVHENTLREEIIRVSAMMDKLRLAEVAQTKRQAEKLQREAVQKTEELWQKKLIEAVEDACLKERNLASQKAKEVALTHRQEVLTILKQAAQEKTEALLALATEKEKERLTAVTETQIQEQVAAEKKIAHLKNLFGQQITILHTKIREHKSDVSRLSEELEQTTQHRQQVIEELLQTREEFQKFIDIVYPFNKSESRYLIPPVKSVTQPLAAEA